MADPLEKKPLPPSSPKVTSNDSDKPNKFTMKPNTSSLDPPPPSDSSAHSTSSTKKKKKRKNLKLPEEPSRDIAPRNRMSVYTSTASSRAKKHSPKPTRSNASKSAVLRRPDFYYDLPSTTASDEQYEDPDEFDEEDEEEDFDQSSDTSSYFPNPRYQRPNSRLHGGQAPGPSKLNTARPYRKLSFTTSSPTPNSPNAAKSTDSNVTPDEPSSPQKVLSVSRTSSISNETVNSKISTSTITPPQTQPETAGTISTSSNATATDTNLPEPDPVHTPMPVAPSPETVKPLSKTINDLASDSMGPVGSQTQYFSEKSSSVEHKLPATSSTWKPNTTTPNSMTVETETVVAGPSLAMPSSNGGTGLKVKKSIDNVNKLSQKAKKKKANSSRPGGSKVQVFAAKIASAVDEVQSSDSDETFVYESNPNEPSPHFINPSVSSSSMRPRFHGRSPSTSSLSGQQPQQPQQQIHLATVQSLQSETQPLTISGGADSYQTLTQSRRSNAQKHYQKQLLDQQSQQIQQQQQPQQPPPPQQEEQFLLQQQQQPQQSQEPQQPSPHSEHQPLEQLNEATSPLLSQSTQQHQNVKDVDSDSLRLNARPSLVSQLTNSSINRHTLNHQPSHSSFYSTKQCQEANHDGIDPHQQPPPTMVVPDATPGLGNTSDSVGNPNSPGTYSPGYMANTSVSSFPMLYKSISSNMRSHLKSNRPYKLSVSKRALQNSSQLRSKQTNGYLDHKSGNQNFRRINSRYPNYEDGDEEEELYNEDDDDFDDDDDDDYYNEYSESTPFRVAMNNKQSTANPNYGSFGGPGGRRAWKGNAHPLYNTGTSNSGSRAYSPHNYKRYGNGADGNNVRFQRIRFTLWMILVILSILGLGFVMGFLLATTKPLHNVAVADVFDILVSDEELMFDVVVEGINPGFLSVEISNVDLDVFARSAYVQEDTASKPKGEPHTMLLGNIQHFEVPLSFEGGVLSRRLLKSVGQFRLVHPGRNTTSSPDDDDSDDADMVLPTESNSNSPGSGGSGGDIDNGQKKWARVSLHPFELIIRGVLKYDLLLSSNKMASISKVSIIVLYPRNILLLTANSFFVIDRSC